MELFSSIIKNEKLKETIASDILKHRISHAYIIEGPDGSGKHTAATEIASALFCERASGGRFPCKECLSCRKTAEGICTDVIYVNRGTKASIGVDTVRDLKETVNYAPVEMPYKVYIIEEADKMTVQAQNSLLLVLEEPPEFVVFLLLCKDSTLLLETVRSRAPVIKMQLFSADDVASILSMKKQYSGVPKDTLSSAAAASGGALGKAELLLSDKDAPQLKEIKLCREILPVLLTGNANDRLSLIKRFPPKRDELISFLETLACALRDLLFVKKTECRDLMFFSDRQEALRLSSSVGTRRISTLYQEIKESVKKVSSNVSIQPLLMLILSKN
ncbi:MAG: hypothetical protein IKN38_08150 [Clostridia bacterium]|nr:hypothetical protein [Clostridia bacterium]